MTSIGSYEAKTHLPQLLERVARGEKILITKHGKPAALLVPPALERERGVEDVIADFKAYSSRQQRSLGKLTARELIDDGRRY